MKKILILVLVGLWLGTIPMASQATDDKPGAEGKNIKEEKSNIKVTFVELGSVRCIPCKKMMPIMKEIEEEYGDQVKVVFHDVWTNEGRPFAYKYKIKLIPTQVFLDKTGNEYFRHQGFFPKEELIKILKQQGVVEIKKAKKETDGAH